MTVDFHRRGVFAQGAVRPAFVVETEERVEVRVCVDLGAIALEIDLVVFDRPPEAFDEDIVERSAFAVHRQFDAESEQRLGELGGRKLATLVCVEDFWDAVLVNGPLHRSDAEARIQRV